MLLLNLNSDIGINILSTVKPILVAILILVIIWSIIRSVMEHSMENKRNFYISLSIQIVVSLIVLYLANNPNEMEKLGNWCVDFISSFGDEIHNKNTVSEYEWIK